MTHVKQNATAHAKDMKYVLTSPSIITSSPESSILVDSSKKTKTHTKTHFPRVDLNMQTLLSDYFWYDKYLYCVWAHSGIVT